MSDVQFHDKQFTASVWLVSDEPTPRVLLIHHRKLGKWMQPGGHIERHENPIQAAVRETWEETGLDISGVLRAGSQVDEYAFLMPAPDFIMEQKIPAHGEQPEHFHIDLEYVVRVPWQEPVLADAEMHGIGWFTREEALKLYAFANTREIVERVLGERFS